MSKCGHDNKIDSHFLCDPCLIKKDMYLWCVITKVPSEKEDGNKYDFVDTSNKNPNKWVSVKVPTFELGELLVVDPYFQRELSGQGRKPNKWEVGTEYYKAKDLKKALLKSVEVLKEFYK